MAEPGQPLIAVAIGAIVFGIPILLCYYEGKRKNREWGFLYGCLSWLGVLLINVLPSR